MIGVGRNITCLPVYLHSHIQKSILSTSNEMIFFQLAINRANEAGWHIWQEKQLRVYIIGMMFFRTLNIHCSCILFSQIMTFCQPWSPDGETALNSISFSSLWNIFIPIRQCTVEGYQDIYTHIYQRKTRIPMRLDIICSVVTDGGKSPAQILSLSRVWGQCGAEWDSELAAWWVRSHLN